MHDAFADDASASQMSRSKLRDMVIFNKFDLGGTKSPSQALTVYKISTNWRWQFLAYNLVDASASKTTLQRQGRRGRDGRVHRRREYY